ncbi:MAG: hypothetical protein J6Q63_08960 [Bacteroidales bacterium]|nr:hypothetical protein [Bacteroidales bacterium]
MKRTIFKIAAWVTGIFVVLILAIQLVLSSSVLTGLINKYGDQFIDGDISFGKAQVSLLKRFPKVTMTLEDFSITYPAERFDSLEKAGAQGHMLYHGCSDIADTLASFKEFSASIRLLPLLKGDIHIPHISMVKPRIFAHSYDEHNANWNIFKTGSEDDEEAEDTTSTAMPGIAIGHISLSEHPHIVYTDSKDTVFAMIDLAKLTFDGKLHTERMAKAKIGLHMDSLFVAGRLGRDTVAMGLDRLRIHERKGHMDFSADAKAFLATRAFGRMRVPISMDGSISFPKDTVTAISLQNFNANIATIPLHADADVRLHEGRTGIQAKVKIDGCNVQTILTEYLAGFIPEAKHVDTDAKINLTTDIDGYYDHATGALPNISATLTVPDASVKYEPFPHDVRLGLQALAQTDDLGKINVDIDRAMVSTAGMNLLASAGAQDLLSDDPMLEIDAEATASLDSLQTFLPDTLNMNASGKFAAEIKGKARLSHLDIYNFSRADLEGYLNLNDISIEIPSDTISVAIDSVGITIGPEELTSRRDPSRKFRLLALNGYVSSVNAEYGTMNVDGSDIRLSAKNSIPEGDDTTKVSRLGGSISAEKLMLKDSEGTSINLDQTTNSFHMLPKRGQPTVPMLTFSSNNKRITLITSANRAILTDSKIKASAAMNTLERKARREAFMDSLARVYPTVPKDSLFRHMMKERGTREVPEWMQEEDFRKSDIDIRLDDAMAKYFREWDLNGSIDVRTGIVMTPYFPLRNIIRGFEVGFNNNEIRIDSMKFVAGESEIAAKGKLSGLRRALLGHGVMHLDVDITSGGMNANELLRAYNAGSSFNPEDMKDLEGASNSEFFKMVTTDTTAVSEEIQLIVVPANLTADISVNASDIIYSDLDISSMTAELVMKERWVQITNTTAKTNMGEMSFDAFYSTRTKKDLKAGFSLGLKDITAEKVIALMPSADTLMPLLKSFKGLLNCQMACTAQIDTNMNIITPTINGVMRIEGDDLSISDNELFRTLARKLLFKNKKEGKIDHMTVEGLIKDNVVEVFPFVLKVDRYTLAMSGLQNLDMSFKYHVSVLKSPFLIRLGIDLYGPDFDNFKFKIGKAKYKTTKIPVFTAVIDDTRINLLSSIKGIFEKGVEAAISENEQQTAINEHKQNIGYVNAVDMQLEELSASEQAQVESDEQAEEAKAAEAADLAADMQAIADNVVNQMKENGIL